MTFGVGGKKYDFKREGTKKGDISYNNPTYFYRGMPIKSKNGEMIFSSARDIGNYAAGYIAGHLQIKWEWARRQFDKLESIILQKDTRLKMHNIEVGMMA